MNKAFPLMVMIALTTVLILQPVKVSAEEVAITEKICLLNVDFEKKPRTRKQALNLSATVQMAITNKIAVNKSFKAPIATNVSCQQLMGASYTGSKAEWAKFFDSALTGLVKSGAKALEFTFVGDNEMVFNGLPTELIQSKELVSSLIAKEYTFTGNVGGNKQVIRNLALLDKKNNTLYTFSVSGNEQVSSETAQEFTRLVKSIKTAE
jgi:hypothetical protein